MVKSDINKLINQLSISFSKNEDIQKVILFGSYAYGKPTEKSDVDICLVVKNDYFDEHDYFMFCALSSKLINAYFIEDRIEYDLIGCTLQDLETPPNGLIQDVTEKGILLYERSTDQLYPLDERSN